MFLIAQLVVQQSITHFGGRYQITPTGSFCSEIASPIWRDNNCLCHGQGFNPYIAEWSPYHGAAYAVIEATARLVAVGANWSKARFSYQEYFERMDKKQSVLVNQYQLFLDQSKLRFNLVCHLLVVRTPCQAPLKN